MLQEDEKKAKQEKEQHMAGLGLYPAKDHPTVFEQKVEKEVCIQQLPAKKI